MRDVLLGGAPAVLVALALLVAGPYQAKTQWTLGLLIVAVWVGYAVAAREHVVHPLRVMSNILAALRDGDYSLRARRVPGEDSLAVAMRELSLLGADLRDQRAGAVEAAALLGKVMSEIDVAILAFDAQRRVVLANRAAERLLGPREGGVIGVGAGTLHLDELLEGAAPRMVETAFPGGASRWEIRRATFRQRGMPHQLLVLSDLSRALREEERLAWQRLVRVLGHEINNSLAPIQSIANQLRRGVMAGERADDWDADADEGLAAIARRAEALGRFLSAYAALARLPPPRVGHVEVEPWIRRVARLEDGVKLTPGPAITLQADPDQLDQLLINLMRNASQAARETGGGVELTWAQRGPLLEVLVLDEGAGIASTDNLFVPFFTTKPAGSGIGLVLARQIAEAHGGTLTLEDRAPVRGAIARLRLPLRQQRVADAT